MLSSFKTFKCLNVSAVTKSGISSNDLNGLNFLNSKLLRA